MQGGDEMILLHEVTEIDFRIGKCYRIQYTDFDRNINTCNAILLERRKNKLYFVTSGEGQIASIDKHVRVSISYGVCSPEYELLEKSKVNNACILIIDLDLVRDVYVRELV